LLKKLNRIFPSRKKAAAAVIGSENLKRIIINISLITIIITAIKAAIEAAKNLKKTVYLFVTIIATNAANRAISRKSAN